MINSEVTAPRSAGTPSRPGRGQSPDHGGHSRSRAAETPQGALPSPADHTEASPEPDDGIAGKSVLRGLVVYAAVLAFACLYADFVIVIWQARGMASLEPALLTAAAALAGVLGSAFALRVGNPSPQTVINQALKTRIENVNDPDIPTTAADKVKRIIHEALSPLEVSAPNKPAELADNHRNLGLLASSAPAAPSPTH